MSEHAPRGFQPSSFYQTMNCPGWHQECDRQGISEPPSKEPAMTGTIAHALADRCLENSEDAVKYVDWWGFCYGKNDDVVIGDECFKPKKTKLKIQFDEEFCDHVQVYLDAVRQSRKELVGAQHFNEQRVDLSYLVPDMSGTLDSGSIEPLGVAIITDLKFGRGVMVEVGKKVGDNVQLSIYALGAIGPGNPNGVEMIKVVIVQPRKNHLDGPVRSIEYDVEELIEWGEKVLKPVGEAAHKPNAPLYSGNWCRWCDVEVTCPKLRKDTVVAMFGTEDVGEAKTLIELAPIVGNIGYSTEELVKLYNLKDRIYSLIGAVEAELFVRVRDGGEQHNLKIVQGYGRRAWIDVDLTEQILTNKKEFNPQDIFAEPKLLTPPQMENLIKKKLRLKPKAVKALISPLTRTPLGDLKLVKSDDKRSALEPVKDMFKKEKA